MVQKALMFWSKTDGPLRALSNFSQHSITIPTVGDGVIRHLSGLTFPSVENAFQAAKYTYLTSRYDESRNIMVQMMRVPAQKAKSMGSKGQFKKRGIALDVKIWDANKDAIMSTLLTLKLKQHPEIQTILNQTGNAYLTHFSMRDKYWGSTVVDCKGRDYRPKTGGGKNMLGLLWMGLRDSKSQTKTCSYSL